MATKAARGTPATGAVAFVAELRANVDALYADEVTHDEHHARNGETWRRVREAGVEVEEEVLRMLRERGSPGSA